jgi:hypothetical protein
LWYDYFRFFSQEIKTVRELKYNRSAKRNSSVNEKDRDMKLEWAESGTV